MNKEEAMRFLLAIAKEIKRSFECPVILLTMKDYADGIFNSLIDMRAALLQNAPHERLLEIVNTFHIAWLQAVQDIENFKKRVKDTPRDIIFNSIDYTMECMKKRDKYFCKYIDQANKSMNEEEKALIQSHLEIIVDLREIVNFALFEKQRSLQNSVDKEEFLHSVTNEIEELLNWLDRLNDYLAIQFCKVLNLIIPQLPTDLNKTLQQVIDEVASHSNPEAQKIAEELCCKGRTLGSLARVVGTINDLEINAVVQTIQNLEERISRLKNETSSAALMALQHKAIFLEDRLESLENLKLSLSFLKNQRTKCRGSDDKSEIIEEDDVRIFNHLLPHQERCRLVEKLINLWQNAISNDEKKSVISILSVADVKEVFSDDLGNFIVDKYGRKIYKNQNDNMFYQLNERDELVDLTDDEKHVYFYDECGRYYLNENRQRVYKAHCAASEYMLHRSGIMLKVSEMEDGVEFRYDNIGRYYINEKGDRIYREKNSIDEYRPDGLGNLVKIRDDDQYYLEPCPIEPMVTEESKYLKKAVGAALKTCLAEIVLVQPEDPISYLADSLEKYWSNIDVKHKRLLEQKEIMVERERLTENASPSSSPTVGEACVQDYNFTNYKSPMEGREGYTDKSSELLTAPA